MSATNLTPARPPATTLSEPVQTLPHEEQWRRGVSLSGWARVALVAAMLLGSLAVRLWQSRRIESALDAGRRGARLDLERIPRRLGPWEGSPVVIDEQIARGTGADQLLTRRYVNRETGATVDLILLHGPAAEMYIHSPELCYPAAGYETFGKPEIKDVPDGEGAISFRSLAYKKGEGALADLQEVYYAWRYDGRWSPDVGIQKRFERIPILYKVHVARHLSPNERRDVGNPCEGFLAALMPELRRRFADHGDPAPAKVKYPRDVNSKD